MSYAQGRRVDIILSCIVLYISFIIITMHNVVLGGTVAEWHARSTGDPRVPGSNPAGG